MKVRYEVLRCESRTVRRRSCCHLMIWCLIILIGILIWHHHIVVNFHKLFTCITTMTNCVLCCWWYQISNVRVRGLMLFLYLEIGTEFYELLAFSIALSHARSQRVSCFDGISKIDADEISSFTKILIRYFIFFIINLLSVVSSHHHITSFAVHLNDTRKLVDKIREYLKNCFALTSKWAVDNLVLKNKINLLFL